MGTFHNKVLQVKEKSGGLTLMVPCVSFYVHRMTCDPHRAAWDSLERTIRPGEGAAITGAGVEDHVCSVLLQSASCKIPPNMGGVHSDTQRSVPLIITTRTRPNIQCRSGGFHACLLPLSLSNKTLMPCVLI